MIPFYESYGERRRTPLILLHSGGLIGAEWQPQIPILATRHYLLIPDLPGHGKSVCEKITIADMAAAIVAMMDNEKISSAHICGSSLGGAVAMYLCINYPQRFQKAVFYRISYRKSAATYQQTTKMANPDYWRRYGLHNWLQKAHFPQGGADAWLDVIARVSTILNPEHSQHDHSLETLAQLKQKVLIIGGDRDPVAPLDELLAMYRAIADSALWIIAQADHVTASSTWRSEAFAQELRHFFAA